MIDKLFESLIEFLEGNEYAAKGGQMIDATLVLVPIQRNSRDENKQIKPRQIPPDWADNPHKRSHKDPDARWTQKNGKSRYGDKKRISLDAAYGFVREHSVNDTLVHDSHQSCDILEGANDSDKIWANSAYRSDVMKEALAAIGYIGQIQKRRYRNHPLTEAQKKTNRGKSKVWAKVEPVFGV